MWRQVGASCWYLASVPLHMGFPGSASGKEPPANEGGVRSLGRKDPLEEGMATHSNILAWRISLFTFMHGEGNGNPLQCSCLENPGDAGAWQAAVYGVAQSRT